MKRLVILSILAIPLAFAYCYWGFGASVKPRVEYLRPTVVGNTSASAIGVAARVASQSGTPVTLPATAQPVTSDRTRIYDSPDVMATINEIRKNGSQDEKDWANYLLKSCTILFAKLPKPSDATEQQPARIPDSAEIAAKKKRAVELLSARCAGVKDLASDERDAISLDLTENTSRNSSTLGKLHSIGDDRWNADQAKLISNSLYSGDPIVARAAFLVIHTALDADAPGGSDRQIALQLALAPVYLNFPLSQYEQLQGCRILGWCDSWGHNVDNSPPNATVARLVGQYRTAIDSHMDARSILAIR